MSIKPLPYYTQQDDSYSKATAHELRKVFLPQIKRRLPNHHLSGFSHRFIIDYVAKWKKTYPYFLRTDIQKFYPTVQPKDLITQTQLAYRDLFGLNYVPKKFKQRFMAGMVNWLQSLPVSTGIPLGSSMSSILAPISLIPFWLELRRMDIRFVVFMDDLLVLCKKQDTANQIWEYLSQALYEQMGLKLNPEKTQCGRFSKKAVEYCGWSFSGGYARISSSRIDTFQKRFRLCIDKSKKIDTRSFIKRLNRKIDGFGNYYKHGHVSRQMELLDQYIRKELRSWLTNNKTAKGYTNEDLDALGLHSLSLCYHKSRAKSANNQPRPLPESEYYRSKPEKTDFGVINQMAQDFQQIRVILSEILIHQRKTTGILENLN